MTDTAAAPRFSIVTAVYDVEPYLPAFIASIEGQRIPREDLEIVAVDDGSSDRSLDLLMDWARRSRFRVKVFTKPNAGQGSARNLGLDHATGEWVTFTDPDDMIHRDFLRVAGGFADAHPAIEVLASKPFLFFEDQRHRLDTHPRKRQYEPANRVANLDDEPNAFPGSASGSLYRRERIEAAGLRFDERVRPNFEDGHFAVRFLLLLQHLDVGLLRDAHYLYRKRAAGTSTLQRSLRDPGRYTNALEFGYLDVVARARDRFGRVPPWIQHLLIYELSWYLGEDEKISSTAYVAPEIAPRFHELLAAVIGELEPEVVTEHRVRRLSSVWVDLLSHGASEIPWHGPHAVRTRVDRVAGLQRVNYRFVGRPPDESFEVDGVVAEPAYAKTMAHRYYGADLLLERILWLPLGRAVRISVDGDVIPLLGRWPRLPNRARWRTRRRRLSAYRHRPVERAARSASRLLRRLRRLVTGRALRLAARTPPWRGRFRGAWLVMDRIHDADDNGERLFEYLRADRPDINAFFAIERGSPDWRRLDAGGKERLLAHGSFAWRMAMLNCAWLLSSHADAPIYRPPQLARTGPATWRFGFLQHGVIKDDLSRWLNHRELDLFVVSTDAELASIAGDGAPYRFTTRETHRTGLPRFDRLLATGRAVPEPDRDLVIVAPTWRQWLTLPLASGSQRRIVDAAFRDSEYIRSWLAILRSPSIAAAIERRGWQLGFMPHPNLQGIWDQLDLPANVVPLSFAGTDVQSLYARCGLLVTDYSSVAFNTAYIDRPVVYFQFDAAAMFGGAHVGRRGYFEYERDGFGPVAADLEAAERAIVAAVERGATPTPEYQARIDATFPVRDGGACARVVAAVEALSRPRAERPG
ncbi:MAG TPA: glycosyltransferase [Candidatus Limnocylindria bacterium]|nr:glycosyltransferase [Candidatus Limnocylindria bacterium]